MSKGKVIAKNTIFLYIRMMIVMIVNLFAVRIILKALGVEDYGLFNVVAGVITMFSCVTSVLMTATQRYYSYSIGEGNFNKLNKIYSASVKICLVGSLFIIFVGETLGIWFINNYLVIPHERLYAANWLFQMTILSFVLNFMQIPFGAAIIAHEKMGYFAAISTLETLLKFLAALLLLVVDSDKLIVYGVFLATISLISLVLYIYIAFAKFPECHYEKVNDRLLYKELLSFTGWNFLGSLAGVGMHYVNMILVNIFFGPIINAAQAIAFQISSSLNTFSGSFIMALRPPMIKLYAENNYMELDRLFAISNKAVFYLMLMLCIPLYLEMNTILLLWLDVEDNNTVLFARLIIIYTIILIMNNPISIIMQATGYVKQYFLPVESVTLLCPFITFFLFKMQFPSYFVFIAMIICVLVSHIIRIYVLNKYYPSPILRDYLIFCLKAIIITICVILITMFVRLKISGEIYRFMCVTTTSIFVTLILVYVLALNKQERLSITKYVTSFIHC